MAQENKRIKKVFEETLKYYEDFYGVTYEVINVDTYILYLDDDEEIGRIRNILNYSLSYILSELIDILKKSFNL